VKQLWAEDNGVVIHLRDGWLKVQPVSEDIIRVAFGPDRAFFEHSSLAVLPLMSHGASVQSEAIAGDGFDGAGEGSS